jgi:hypothetical protein
MAEVKKHMGNLTDGCIGPSDIVDWNYFDAWADDCTPKHAAILALRNAGWE